MSDFSIYIWVQHLFGKGHVRRMAHVAQACAEKGMDVTVVAGGPGGRAAFRGLENVSAHQLPALRTRDHQYTGLLTSHDEAPSEIYWQMRQEAALEVLEITKPDVVMVELFPFGRRKFAREVLPLIDAARHLPTRPLIVSSVRDIIEPKLDSEKSAQMEGWLRNCCDAVLVHGDESIIRLEETAPYVTSAGVPLYYTGYIAPTVKPARTKSGVVISAGSGLSGGDLLKIAAEAGNLVATPDNPWHIFVPPGVDVPALGNNAHVSVHPFGKSFAALLARAEVSVSEAGYNTLLEALAADTRPVLVAYGEASQTEQPRRAARFAERGLAVSLAPETLTPTALIKGVEAAKTLGNALGDAAALNLSGSSTVPNLLKDLREGGLAS